MALDQKYLSLLEAIGCPFVTFVMPDSLACDDLSAWIAGIRKSLPTIKIPDRLLRLAGMGPDPAEMQYLEEEEDVIPYFDPMDLKRHTIPEVREPLCLEHDLKDC